MDHFYDCFESHLPPLGAAPLLVLGEGRRLDLRVKINEIIL